MTRDRALLAATCCFLALAAALLLFWLGWLARGRPLTDPYGMRAHGFALLAGAMCLLHGAATRGLRRALAFLAATWSVGLGAELVGLLTGQVFGHYHYTDAVPAKIFGLVPVVVPVVWAIVSYLAWTTAGARGAVAVAPMPRPVLATALFVAYDLVADPNHLHRGGWVYEGGGAYHGVPLHNFLGWAALGFLSFSAIARIDRERSRPAASAWGERLPIAAYAMLMAHEAMFALAFPRAWLPSALALGVVGWTLCAMRSRAAALSAP